MKKCTNRTVLQIMKCLHLIFVSIWLGGVICAAVLFTIAFFQWDGTQFTVGVPILMQMYPKVILPAAILVLLQGICYGVFTKWGFFQQRWLRWKWILLVVTGLCTGLGMMNQLQKVLARIPQQGFQGGLADGNLTLLFLLLQVIFLLTMVVLSVFKVRKNP